MVHPHSTSLPRTAAYALIHPQIRVRSQKWYFWATHSRLQPIIDAARTIRKHWDGVLQWFTSRLTNAILEGINSLVQAAKARARGYRTLKNFICISYIIAGRLDFALPT